MHEKPNFALSLEGSCSDSLGEEPGLGTLMSLKSVESGPLSAPQRELLKEYTDSPGRYGQKIVANQLDMLALPSPTLWLRRNKSGKVASD